MGDEYLWIVMEHCGGGSVRDVLTTSGSPLNEAQIAYLCGETLKVRRGAHFTPSAREPTWCPV